MKLGVGVYPMLFIMFSFGVINCFWCLTEFNNAGCLLISEVKYLLENRDKDAPDTAYVDPPYLETSCLMIFFSVYNKTLEYVKTFAKFNTTDSASAVREYAAIHLRYCWIRADFWG